MGRDERQLRADLAWYRTRAREIGQQLDELTPGHAEAIGRAAVLRMHADAHTFAELADELEAYLERTYPSDDPPAPAPAADEPALF